MDGENTFSCEESVKVNCMREKICSLLDERGSFEDDHLIMSKMRILNKTVSIEPLPKASALKVGIECRNWSCLLR